jgi:hypothetical protein
MLALVSCGFTIPALVSLWIYYSCIGQPVDLLFLHWSACEFTTLALVSLWIYYSCIGQPVHLLFLHCIACGFTTLALVSLWIYYSCIGLCSVAFYVQWCGTARRGWGRSKFQRQQKAEPPFFLSHVLKTETATYL